VRHRIAAVALALVVVAGCDASFGGTNCRDKDGNRDRQEQPSAGSGQFGDG
jgi:hypothetical protein